jgi:hypothetical protein
LGEQLVHRAVGVVFLGQAQVVRVVCLGEARILALLAQGVCLLSQWLVRLAEGVCLGEELSEARSQRLVLPAKGVCLGEERNRRPVLLALLAQGFCLGEEARSQPLVRLAEEVCLGMARVPWEARSLRVMDLQVLQGEQSLRIPE